MPTDAQMVRLPGGRLFDPAGRSAETPLTADEFLPEPAGLLWLPASDRPGRKRSDSGALADVRGRYRAVVAAVGFDDPVRLRRALARAVHVDARAAWASILGTEPDDVNFRGAEVSKMVSHGKVLETVEALERSVGFSRSKHARVWRYGQVAGEQPTSDEALVNLVASQVAALSEPQLELLVETLGDDEIARLVHAHLPPTER